MGSVIKSIGHGLLAAGILLIVIYGLGAYLRGREAFRDALDPTAIKTYLALLPLAPGLLLLWLGDLLTPVAAASLFGSGKTVSSPLAAAEPELRSTPACSVHRIPELFSRFGRTESRFLTMHGKLLSEWLGKRLP